jgi:Holliday junction DNA helicase RuvA
MIESLSGKIISINNNELVLSVGPVNVLILVPSSEKYTDLIEGDDLTIKTILDVKEDSISLIGFLDNNERKLFQKLISVKGVGSKVAITILSTITIEEIIESVASNNHNIVKQVPGIGDKTAKLILIQLQGQLDNIAFESSNLDLDIQIEATKAVEALGYEHEQIRKIINDINTSNIEKLDTESLIRIIIEKISIQNQS